MVSESKFLKAPVRVGKGLSLGSDYRPGMIVVPEFLDAAIASGSVGTGLSTEGWTMLDVDKLAKIAGSSGMPKGAKGVVLDAEINDSGGAGTDCYMQFAKPGAIVAGQTFTIHAGSINDRKASGQAIVPCTDDGKVAWNYLASGGNTLDYSIKLIGWIIGGSLVAPVTLPCANLKAKFFVKNPA